MPSGGTRTRQPRLLSADTFAPNHGFVLEEMNIPTRPWTTDDDQLVIAVQSAVAATVQGSRSSVGGEESSIGGVYYLRRGGA